MRPTHVRVWLASVSASTARESRLENISPHTISTYAELCSHIAVGKMSLSEQVAAAVVVLDESDVFTRRKNERRDMWVKKWIQERPRFTHLNLLDLIRKDSPNDYKNYFRMFEEDFNVFLAKNEIP
ncbi:hypothetical protein PR048_011831 [Dryococelus australis]|uniref:DUF4143 domain-containing protein n=1 Tax=Dryococelus australis TaxID=614101 RepID=A0ABQ9HMQ6_9NEOP|nr:hypothetical protein PR048_011831 [Dryococelus australis]